MSAGSEAIQRERRRRLPSDVRRERILEAATRVFAERGYDATSFGDIAKVAGITRPVVYDHFKDKAELHLLLLERERDRILEHVTVQLVADASAEDRVSRALDAYFDYVETHPYAWRLLFREAAGDTKMANSQRRIQSEAHLAVATILAKERGSKILSGRDKEARLQMLAALWGSATNGLARWWYDNRQVPRKDIVATAMDALWLGVERLRTGERWRRRRRQDG
ncbi:MAG: TetR/AcrR family transcriptional regulator [Actinomycetota bacterium]|nr:TetR/AcrR family transcriptional regulator [Actinomycetota bacterium]